MAETEKKKPQDRLAPKATKATAAKEKKEQQEALAELMSTGVDFSPFTIDAGDGKEWSFNPDPMPSDSQALINAMNGLHKAMSEQEDAEEAFGALVEAVRSRLLSEEQREEFPLPIYGTNAMLFFAMHLATGRDGFPTQSD